MKVITLLFLFPILLYSSEQEWLITSPWQTQKSFNQQSGYLQENTLIALSSFPRWLETNKTILRRSFHAGEYSIYKGTFKIPLSKDLLKFSYPNGKSMTSFNAYRLYSKANPINNNNDITDVYFTEDGFYIVNRARVYYKENGKWHSIQSSLASSPKVKDQNVIKVTSTPSYAEVYIDGTFLGYTPYTIKNVKDGNHIIKVLGNGFDTPEPQSVTLKGNTTYSYHFTLKSKKEEVKDQNVIKVTSTPSYAEVYVDGYFTDYTPCTIENVHDGYHSIKVIDTDNNVADSQSVNLEGNSTYSYHFTLKSHKVYQSESSSSYNNYSGYSTSYNSYTPSYTSSSSNYSKDYDEGWKYIIIDNPFSITVQWAGANIYTPTSNLMNEFGHAIQGDGNRFATNASLNTYSMNIFNLHIKTSFAIGFPLDFKKTFTVETPDNKYTFWGANDSVDETNYYTTDTNSTMELYNFTVAIGASLPITSYFRAIYYVKYSWEDFKFSLVYDHNQYVNRDLTFDNDHWSQQFYVEILPFRGYNNSGFFVSYELPFIQDARTENWHILSLGFSTRFNFIE